MPKLKKHSQMLPRPPSDTSQDRFESEEGAQAENVKSNSDFLRPTRMKLAQRVQFFTKLAQKQQKTQPKGPQQQGPQAAFDFKEDPIDNFLNKYTDNDDDDIEVEERKMEIEKKKSNKVKKNEIRTSNKLFSHLNYEQEMGQAYKQQQHETELYVQKRQRKEGDQFLDKFQKKATTFKNKLEYKELTKDARYKSYMHEKLGTLEQTDQINLVVQVPKLFGGNKTHIEASLFLKNSKEEKSQFNQHNSSITQTNEDDVSLPKDRKTYYQELGKHVRLKKAEIMTQNSLKDCFRKSMLDDKDYIPDLENTNMNNSVTSIRESQISRPLHRLNKQKTESSKQVEWQSRPTQKQITIEKVVEWDVSKSQEKKEQKPVEFKKKIIELDTRQDEDVIVIDDDSVPLREPEPIKGKSKLGKNRTKRQKKKGFQFQAFIEVEADISDDELEGGPKHHDEDEQNSDDETDVDSLIDNEEIKITTKEKRLLQKKYIQDVMDEEERLYEAMKKKMEARYFQDDQKLKKRMEEVSKKYTEKAKREQEEKNKLFQEANQNIESISVSDNTAERQRNKQKLAQLEQLLGKDKKHQKQIRIAQAGIRVNKLEQIQQGLLQKNTQAANKVKRNGLKDMQAHKRPITINYKKK